MIDPKNIFVPIETKEAPTFNELLVPSDAVQVRTQPISFPALMTEIKKCPELIGIMQALVTDILSDGFRFEDSEGKEPKQKIKKVNEFIKSTRFRSELKACLLDWVSMGNQTMWMGRANEKQLKELGKTFGLSAIETKALIQKLSKKGDPVNPVKVVKQIPFSTVNIDMTKDKTRIKRFRQVISGDKAITWDPEEVIFGRYLRLDGKVYGFSPAQAAISVITTLTKLKDYHGYHFDNAGIPDWMFIMPKEFAGSPNAEKMIERLRKYKSTKHKGGNLVFTGEVNPIQLNHFDKEMEYQNLAIYYTGILALSWNMPLTRVATILGTKVRATGTGADLSDAGYWRSISCAQDFIEELYNTRLFNPEFGLNIKFNRGYKNDEVKEMQALSQKMPVVQQMKNLNIVNDEWIYNFLGIEPKFRAKGKIELPAPTPFGGSDKPFDRQTLQKDKDVSKGDAGKNVAERKKLEQESKELKEVVNMSLPTLFFDIETVNEFMNLVEEMRKVNPSKKVHYADLGDRYEFFLTFPDENYRLKIKKSELTAVELPQLLGIKIVSGVTK